MKALITGASTGIGREMALILGEIGYDLILVARSKEKLEKVKNQISTNVEIISMDLSSTFNCMKLYNKVKKEDIEIVINNAGFGLHGYFEEIKVDKELDMIDLNIKAVQVLTKMFLNDFLEKDNGYILNVASSAAYMPGPLMASYYASKAYVLHLTEAIAAELKVSKSLVYVGALCPGPVRTEFQKRAGVNFSMKPMEARDVAEIAIDGMFRRKTVILPGLLNKIAVKVSKFVPRSILLKVVRKNQEGKIE